MASKTSDLLNSIPSVSELLEKPPVRALAERLNRSVVAAGVRSFLDELRTDLQRRAAEANLPSIRELAERAARHVVAISENSQRPVINATGRLHGPPWASTPLPEAALERVFGMGRDFTVETPLQTGRSWSNNDAITRLCRITQAQAATVVHSYAGAVWLMLAALADKHDVLVSRAELGDVEAGLPLPQLAASAGAALAEVGTTNRTTAADYEAAVSPRTAVILRVCPDAYRVVGETTSAELDQLVGLARDRELILVEAAGTAPLTDLPPTLGIERRSVAASLAMGLDLVVVRGDGLVGGPSCGIVVGNRELVARIANHPLCAAWQLDALRAAALAATLDADSTAPAGQAALPVLRLLTTPLENLRDRAERLAPQLARAAGIAAAEPVATQSHLAVAGQPDHGLDSYGIAITPADADLRGLERRLLAASQPVVGRIEGQRIILDLRTVFPRQDQVLVEALVPPAAVDSANG